MKRIHIVGGKNHGKTTFLAELIGEFKARGLRVGAIKHTHHHHELDTPGKDSHRHRQAGAELVGILSRSMNAIFWENHESDDLDVPEADSDWRYHSFNGAFESCDLVLVEGDTTTSAPKLEVWRAANNAPPIAGRVPNVYAIVTDDEISSDLPVLMRSDVAAAADFILTNLLEESTS